MAIADSITPTTEGGPDEYALSVWGPNGARLQSAAAIMGDYDTSVSITEASDLELMERISAPAGTLTYGRRDLGYMIPLAPGSNAVRALELMQEYGVPVGISRVKAQNVTQMVFRDDATTNDTFLTAVFNLLDRRIAASDVVPPLNCVHTPPTSTCPDEVLALRRQDPLLNRASFESYADPAMALPAHQSRLRSVYGVTKEDIADAIRLLRAKLTLFTPEYSITTPVTGVAASEDPAIAPQLSVRIARLQHRSQIGLASLLAAELPAQRPLKANPLDPILRPGTNIAGAGVGYSINNIGGALCENSASCRPTDWYDWEHARLRRVGASGALHHLRTHLRRIVNPTPVSTSVVKPPALNEALRATEGAIGSVWTEWDAVTNARCLLPNEPLALREYPPCGDNRLCLSSATGSGESTPGCRTVGWESRRAATDGRHATWTIHYPTTASVFERSDYTLFVTPSENDAACRLGTISTSSCRDGEGEMLSVAATCAAPVDDGLGGRARTCTILTPRDANGNAYFAGETNNRWRTNTQLYFVWRSLDPATGRYDRLLVDAVRLQDDVAVHAFNGDFGARFQSLLQVDPDNPGMPAVNSLGFANDLVPPLENELSSNGTANEDSYAIWLARAHTATANASALVSAARSNELELLQNERADEALIAEAALTQQSIEAAACGNAAGQTRCVSVQAPPQKLGELLGLVDPGEDPWRAFENTLQLDTSVLRINGMVHPWPINSCETFIAFYRMTGDGGFDPDAYSPVNRLDEFIDRHIRRGLECTRWHVRRQVYDLNVASIPVPVQQELMRPEANGTFPNVQGELKVQYIEIFNALVSIRESVGSFDASFFVAIEGLNLAVSQMDDATRKKDRMRCRLRRAFKWIGQIASMAASLVATVFTAGAASALFVLAVIGTVGTATAEAAKDAASGRCGEGRAEEARSVAEESLMDAFENMEAMYAFVYAGERALRKVAVSNEQIRQLEERVATASARRAIQERIFASNSIADAPEWRALQSILSRQARDSVFRAQRYAFVARRAIEFRMPVAMPFMTVDEPFTTAPGLWSNDIFVAHFASAPGPTWANAAGHIATPDLALERYVDDLDDFVAGYSFQRRIQTGSDTQVVNLQLLDVLPGDGAPPEPFHHRLSYKCRDALVSLPFDSVRDAPGEETICSSQGGVEFAEYRFVIPQNLSGYFGERLAAGNFNYRHAELAANLVGSQIVDCESADRPNECYRDQNLRYSIRQLGSVSIENFDSEIHRFEMEPGLVLNARALVAGRILTNPLTPTDAALIETFKRRELVGRPLTGVYILRIDGRPEVMFAHLEGIQLLLRYNYWTRQR